MKSLFKLLVLAAVAYGGWWLVDRGHVQLEWPPFGESAAPAATGPCVDLNTADDDALERIVHITSQRARDIRRLRLEDPFRSLDQLTQVPGIGEGRVEEIRRQGLVCDL